MLKIIAYTLAGTGFTFFTTILGAATVFFFKGEVTLNLQRAFLGFAAGIMIAASVWSLLIPAVEMAESQNQSGLLSAGAGFAAGGLFLLILDSLMPHLHPGFTKAEGLPSNLRRTTMLIMAVTLHNIPEGMAVGLAFSIAAQSEVPGTLSSAIALAIGIGIQNIPEGAAISLPLKREGLNNFRAFIYGSLSGIVEPIFGILAAVAAGSIAGLMPWILSFAAGAMIYVVVEELIPEAHLGEHSHIGTISIMAGFLLMMLLDVGLG